MAYYKKEVLKMYMLTWEEETIKEDPHKFRTFRMVCSSPRQAKKYIDELKLKVPCFNIHITSSYVYHAGNKK